ncbi:T9SS type A sorting domain-containing protein [Polaribacter sp.]|nr:T9SS type A sorting domain-containing protein [Polaribacter sp.]
MKTKNYKILKTLAVFIFMGYSVLSTQAQIYVDAAATTGANDGSSWSDAFTDLQPALDAAAENAEIRVVAGTYYPTATPGGTDKDKAFHFNKDLVLKGSYYSFTNTQDFTNPSILSGDFKNDDKISDDGSITENSENALHVLITANLTAAAQIEGFLITGGNANGSGSISYSGKSFFKNSGGGIYNYGSSPSIVNTVFSGNSALNIGGGMYNTVSSPSIVNVVFSENHAQFGGGIANVSSSPSIINMVFSGNVATTSGGGISNSGSFPSIINTVFNGNSATRGGGIDNTSSSAPKIYNIVLFGNGSDIENSSSTRVIGWSNFSENYTQAGFTTLDADPFLDSANPKGADGVWFTDDDGLQPSSATSPIIDAGDATILPLDTADLDKDQDITEAIPFDITGRIRIAGSKVDVGAYEVESGAVLSVKEIDSSSLNIYSSGDKTLVIHGVFNAKTTANVYSLQGKLVASKTFNKFSTSNTLDVSTLSTGIYIVEMYNSKHQVHTKKLFIQ